jgi:hypothetical protein
VPFSTSVVKLHINIITPLSFPSYKTGVPGHGKKEERTKNIMAKRISKITGIGQDPKNISPQNDV